MDLRKISASLAMVGILWFGAVQASADEVHLENGSRLIGTVIGIEDGKLTMETDFAGTVTISMDQVARIVTDEPLNVGTEAGEIIQGRLVADDEGAQAIESEAVGIRPLPPVNMSTAWAIGTDSPAERAQRAALEAAMPRWSLRLEAGLNGETGNTERISFNGRVTARRTTDSDRLSIYGAARYTREGGEDTTRYFLAGTGYEVDLSDRLFAFGRVEFEHDRFEDIDLRATGTVGLGYFVIRSPESDLRLRAGFGIQHEDYRSDRPSDTSPIAELGADYRREITPWLNYNFNITYFPTLDDFNDYRIVMENSAEIPLSSDEQWKLRTGVRNNYRGAPSPGLKRLETIYFLNLVMDF